MGMSATESLTEAFYAWERRGRGWDLWPEPVELEPPFTPFGRRLGSQSPVQDDGRRPTFLSSWTDRLLGSRSKDLEPDVDELKEPLPRPDSGCGPHAELLLSLPLECDVSPETVEHFLTTMPMLRRPMAFEATGTASEITLSFVCDFEDERQVAERLKAFFPEAVLRSTSERLIGLWLADQSVSTVVVEFGLSEEFMVPLRTVKRFSVDPLTAVTAALGDLEPGEAGLLQVLFEPVRHPWARSITRAVLDDAGSPFFIDAPEITAQAKEKVSRPLFAAVIRVAARSASPERSMLLARSIGWSLNSVANPPANRLIPLANPRDYPDWQHEQDLLDRRSRRSGMILSSAELVALVHPPSAAVRSEKLVRLVGKTRAAPAITYGHQYRLGENNHGGRTTTVALSAEQRSRHIYVIGASGTGKSTLLLSLILQDLERGEGLALLDPHGDLVDEVVRRCPKERVEDVVLLDPANAEYSIGFNILSAHTELERTLLSSDLVAVFRRLSTSWGDQMTSVLGNAMQAFLESDRGGTLLDLRRFLVEPAFRKEFLSSVQDPAIVYYWEKEFPLLAGKPQAPLLTRLDIFLRPKTIRAMVGQKGSRLDLRALMDRGKVLLCRLSQGAIGEENSYLLGTLLVSKLQQLAMSRQDVAASERRPFYLYIDEFHNFVTPSMEAILSGARKYGLGLVLAHQDLHQIRSRSPEVLNAVLSNPYTRVCFRVGDQDARTLADGFVHFDARDLQSLSTGQAIVRVERAEYDFTLTTRRLPSLAEHEGEDARLSIVERSCRQFGRPRAEIEELLHGEHGESHAVATLPEASSVRQPPAPTRPIPRVPPTEKVSESHTPVKVTTSPLRPGRGGQQHKYLQELVRRWANANDWKVAIEESILEGLGSVDVALRKGGQSVACEVTVTTTPTHEVQNIMKCLAAGFDRVVVVSSERGQLQAIDLLLQTDLETAQQKRVICCTPLELFDHLDSLETPSSPTESHVRGYRVRVRSTASSAPGVTDRKKAVAAVIATALKRMRNRK